MSWYCFMTLVWLGGIVACIPLVIGMVKFFFLSFIGNELFWKGFLCNFVQVGGAVCMEVVTE